MFTGIVGAVGSIQSIQPVFNAAGDMESAVITVDAGSIVTDLEQGGSLSVNGVCLTATRTSRLAEGQFRADVMGETLRRTNLGQVRAGSRVNLERCMPATGRFDGHVVQGHIDAVGTVIKSEDCGLWRTLRIEVPLHLSAHLAEKGAVTVSGTSLTVTAVSSPGQVPAWFEVGLIPATLESTVLGDLLPKDTVNIETDALAKYMQRFLEVSAFISGDSRVSHQGYSEQSQPQKPLYHYSFDRVEAALDVLRAGGAVVVVDDADRENEGDIIFAAEHSTPELMGFTIRYTSGVICVPMPDQRADTLELAPMVAHNEDPKTTAYTVSCDARSVTSTGISAEDRSITVQALAASETGPEQLTRPGHIFPLRAVDGGVLQRAGHTEAAVDLCRLAGLSGVAVIAELVHDDGSMMRYGALQNFAAKHRLPLIAIADLVTYLGEGI